MKRAMKTFLIFCALWCSLAARAQAQPSPPIPTQVYIIPAVPPAITLDLMQELEALLAQDSSEPGPSLFSLKKKYLTARMKFELSSLQHRRNVFDWQHASSIIIFWW